MFKRSRLKIVAAIMGILVLFMAAVLVSVYAVSFLESEKQNRMMLDRYVETYVPAPSGMRPPGDMDGFRPRDQRTFNASSFYSVAFSKEGNVLFVDSGNNRFDDDGELTELARKLLESGKTSGKTDNLLYQVAEKSGYTLVAMIDVEVTSGTMRILLNQILITGGIAIIVIFFIAHYLAYRIVKPLEESDRRQKQFVSDAGHELKTPVAVISTNTELLERQIGENEWLQNIRYETERMGTLVTQLLDLSHAENAEVQTETIDLSHLTAGEALPFESVAFEAGLEIVTDIEEGIEVEGSRTQLSQLVSILLDNAVRHAKGGKEIVLTLKKEHKQAVLSVTNSGDGIPPEVREKLFERFYRVDEARNSEGKHYGLGLAIAKAIAEGHHGSIEADSRDGKVTFTVKIPAKN